MHHWQMTSRAALLCASLLAAVFCASRIAHVRAHSSDPENVASGLQSPLARLSPFTGSPVRRLARASEDVVRWRPTELATVAAAPASRRRATVARARGSLHAHGRRASRLVLRHVSTTCLLYAARRLLIAALPAVVAPYDYVAATDDDFDFDFAEGGVIAVTATREDGFWSGEVVGAARRMPGRRVFPSNFARRM